MLSALTKEEKFNHAHAQLRNVIERAYGVLKARFPILKQMAPFPFGVQRDVVIACFAVHNFIRMCNIHDVIFMEFEENTTAPMQNEESEWHMEEKGDEGDHEVFDAVSGVPLMWRKKLRITMRDSFTVMTGNAVAVKDVKDICHASDLLLKIWIFICKMDLEQNPLTICES
ncbi:hypothetical protein LXL04_016411 [Taraxacum kok-saghyz]